MLAIPTSAAKKTSVKSVTQNDDGIETRYVKRWFDTLGMC